MRSADVKARLAVLSAAAVTVMGVGAGVADAAGGAASAGGAAAVAASARAVMWPGAGTRPEAAAGPATGAGPAAGAGHAAAAARSSSAAARSFFGRCVTAQLGLSFHGFNAAAGQRFLTLVLLNRSHFTCRIGGYPGLQFYAVHNPLVTHVIRVPGPHGRIFLHPGQAARACLQWGAISPPFSHPHVVAVTPPGDFAALVAVWRWGPVYRGTVSTTALRPGRTCL